MKYSVKMLNKILYSFLSYVKKGKTLIDIAKAEDWMQQEEAKGNSFPKGTVTANGFIGTKNTVNMNDAMTKVQKDVLDIFNKNLDYIKGTKGYTLDEDNNLIEHTLLRRVKKPSKNMKKAVYNNILAEVNKVNKTNNKTSNK